MSRQCFLSDDDGHWFAVDVDKRGFFNMALDRAIATDDYDEFEDLFGDDRLDMDISNYSFDNLREEEND